MMGLLVGSGLFAIGTWRARSLSRPAAALLAVGAVVVVFGLAGVSGGLMPRELALVAVFVSVLAFPAGWAALGVSALRVDRGGAAPLEGAMGGAPAVARDARSPLARLRDRGGRVGSRRAGESEHARAARSGIDPAEQVRDVPRLCSGDGLRDPTRLPREDPFDEHGGPRCRGRAHDPSVSRLRAMTSF